MKSVLMIAYSFPPEGNAGTYRPLRFVRHLHLFGWRGSVISAGGTQFERYDPDLLAQVPDGTEIIRVANRDDLWQSLQLKRTQRLQERVAPGLSGQPARHGKGQNGLLRSRIRELVRRAESWCYHPDMQMHWIGPAVEATLQAFGRNRPDVLWATGAPWSSFVVAQRAARLTGVPYVLDFRTPWTIVPNSFEAMRPTWAQKRDRRLLRELLSDAQAVTFFYEAEAECFWRLYDGALDSGRIHIIPNGFDGELEDFVSPQSDKFTIIYTGTLSDYRYDTFIEALRRLKSREPARALRMTVRFVGDDLEALTDVVNAVGLADMVSTSAPVRHAEVDRLYRDAHALLMLERQPTLKGYELLAGAKLFGYLKAGRPILGVVPHGEAERVLRHVGVSTIADPDSPDKICAVLEDMLNAWSAGNLSSLVPERSACEHYSAKEQTAALTRALEGLPPLKPFVPGSADIVPSLRAEIGNGNRVRHPALYEA